MSDNELKEKKQYTQDSTLISRVRGGNRYQLNELQSRTIDWLRFPLIISVIFIHNAQLKLDAPYPLITSDTISLSLLADYIRIWISWVATHIAVPCFFVISGFLFFLKTPDLTRDIYKSKIKKRFYTLFIPYIIWNLIPFFIDLGLKLSKPLLHGWSWFEYGRFVIDQINTNGFLNVFWKWNTWGGYYPNWLGQYIENSGPYNLPLWYLRDLIVVTLLTPLLYVLVKKAGRAFIAILIVLYFGGISSSIPGTSTTTLLYFSTGAYLAINRKNIIVEFRKIENPCYLLAVIFMLLATYFSGNRSPIGHYFYCGYILTGVVSAFNIASRLLESGKTKVHPILTSSVFFIYAFHTNWFVGLYDRILNKGFAILGADSVNVFTYVTTPFVKAVICILVFVLINRYVPRVGKVLTGSR